MNDIVGDTRDPPGKRHGPAPDQQIGDGAEGAVKQTENAGKNGIGQGSGIFTKAPGKEGEQGPGVKIHDPPDPESVQAAL